MAKVLIVEDEPVMVSILEFILKGKGFEVVHAERGQDGLVLAEVEAPDVIILDMMLPDLDGVQFCRQLRATSAIKPALPALQCHGVVLHRIQHALALFGRGLSPDRSLFRISAILTLLSFESAHFE